MAKILGRLVFVAIIHEGKRARKVKVGSVSCTRDEAPPLAEQFKSDNYNMDIYAVWSCSEVIYTS